MDEQFDPASRREDGGPPPKQVWQGGVLQVHGGRPQALPPGGEQKYSRWKSPALPASYSTPVIWSMSPNQRLADGSPRFAAHSTTSLQAALSGVSRPPHFAAAFAEVDRN